MPTKTQRLETKIHNEKRRMLRAMESGDVKRLLRVKAVSLPMLEDEIDCHNAVVVQIGVAKAHAEALVAVIGRPRLYFRRSYKYERFLEDLIIRGVKASH